MLRSARFWLSLSLLVTGCVCLFLVQQVVRHMPDNHVGYDPQMLMPVVNMSFGIAVLVLVRLWRRGERRPLSLILALVLGGAAIAGLVVLDRCNLLVRYDVWSHRGLPGFGTCR